MQPQYENLSNPLLGHLGAQNDLLGHKLTTDTPIVNNYFDQNSGIFNGVSSFTDITRIGNQNNNSPGSIQTQSAQSILRFNRDVLGNSKEHQTQPMNDDYFNPLKMKHGYGYDQEEDNMSFYENADS